MSYQFSAGVTVGSGDAAWLFNRNGAYLPSGNQERLPTWSECTARAKAMKIFQTDDKYEGPRATLEVPRLAAAAPVPPDEGIVAAIRRGICYLFGE